MATVVIVVAVFVYCCYFKLVSLTWSTSLSASVLQQYRGKLKKLVLELMVQTQSHTETTDTKVCIDIQVKKLSLKHKS